MKKITILLILAFCISLNIQAQETKDDEHSGANARVVGGNNVEVGEFPWMVSLVMSNGTPGCGASLIDSMWVLTAGHCITNDLPFPNVPTVEQVIVNSIINDVNSLEVFSELIDIEEIIVHEDYAGILAGGNGPDIALIRLGSPSAIAPIALAEVSDTLSYSHQMPAKVLGWGRTETGGDNVDTLRLADCYFISSDTCANLYEASSFDPSPYDANAGGNICAGFFMGEMPAGAAQGDSGGPLFYEEMDGNFKQVGIVSGGNSDVTTVDFPGIFTLIPKYTEWIDSIMMDYDNLPTSVTNYFNEKLSITYYANTRINIEGLQNECEYALSIYDISGKLRKTEPNIVGSQSHELSVSNLPSGIHVLKILNLSQGLIHNKKFLVK